MKHGMGVFVVTLLMLAAGQPDKFAGEWAIVANASTPVDPFRNVLLDIRIDGDAVILMRTWIGSDNVRGVDSLFVTPGAGPATVPMRFWLDNRHLGVRVEPGATREVTAQWKDDEGTLAVEQRMTVNTSQGSTPLRIYSEYRLAPDDSTLEVIELRSTRSRPMTYIFRRVAGEG